MKLLLSVARGHVQNNMRPISTEVGRWVFSSPSSAAWLGLTPQCHLPGPSRGSSAATTESGSSSRTPGGGKRGLVGGLQPQRTSRNVLMSSTGMDLQPSGAPGTALNTELSTPNRRHSASGNALGMGLPNGTQPPTLRQGTTRLRCHPPGRSGETPCAYSSHQGQAYREWLPDKGTIAC